ncbi:MAG TPA: SsrA-binding protein SmpB [Bacillota bacterium]|nr:SsrA-binding protein SmpB [Bacillota bacterium]
MNDEIKVVATNRKARHEYHVEETVEAGLVLVGSEVKALRLGRASLTDSYARFEGGEAQLYNLHISPYEQANQFNHEPKRTRKLLLHKAEIRRLLGKVTQRGYTVIPLRLYFRGGRAKVELALARGKQVHDRRRDIAERDAQRAIQRALKERS